MRRGNGVWVTGVLLLLVLSTGVNVAQAQRIRTLVNQSGAQVRLVGTPVAAIEASSLDGKPMEIVLGRGLPTVLYYFSSTCGWCERNWANFEALAKAGGDRYRFVAVSAEKGLKPFVEKRGLRVEVFEQLSDETVLALRLAGTPTTIVVGPDGVITHDWRGAYSERLVRQIEDLFGVKLPGLQTEVPEGAGQREGFQK
jgi:hypothetical protein